MFKRILSFVLILCMGMCVNTNVYAKEVQELPKESENNFAVNNKSRLYQAFRNKIIVTDLLLEK